MQIRFSGTRNTNGGVEEGEGSRNCGCDTPSGILVEANAAYSHAAYNGQVLEAPFGVDVDVDAKLSRENGGTRSMEEASKETEYEREMEQIMTKNVAYAKPLPAEPWSNELIEDREEHTYEYIH